MNNEENLRRTKTREYVLKNIVDGRRCANCGKIVLRETETKKYPFQCLHCDESLYRFETYMGEKMRTEEINELIDIAMEYQL